MQGKCIERKNLNEKDYSRLPRFNNDRSWKIISNFRLQNKKRDVFDMHGKRIEGTIAADYRDKYPETISGIHLLSSLTLWLIIWVLKAEKMFGHEVSEPFLKDPKRS